jgi:Protein of unknown function (DUF3054)
VRRGGAARALADTAGLLVFAAVGIAMHGAGFSAGPILRNIVPILGVWFLLAPLTGIYRRPGWRSLLLHWAVALPIAVAARQWWVGRLFSRATVAFLIASLVLTLAILVAGRLVLWLADRRSRLGR